uniref:R13L1/DRL21-like LRR repeat region domain-containing protein n=1 Tax=Quercus lobata TaxID=97700 RepID=A0A7N2MYE4_QUELO
MCTGQGLNVSGWYFVPSTVSTALSQFPYNGTPFVQPIVSINGPTQSENVLEGLQPNSNLKKLCVICYRGSKFSTWMKDSLLPNLVEISLENCRSYEHLPPLGNLPYLKVLVLTSNHIVKYLGNEFYGDSAIVFPSLESLELCDMTNLEEWRTVNGKESFPHLRTLLIAGCSKDALTSLSYLAIEYCSSLMSIPNELQNLTALKTLIIRECPHLKRRCKKGSGVDWHKR